VKSDLESRLSEATALLERGARIIENDDWRDAYDAFLSGVELAPDGSAKYSTLCYEGDCAKMTGRARPCPVHESRAPAHPASEAENLRLQILFQQVHGCHHSWVSRGDNAEKALAASEARVKAADRITSQLKASFEEWPENTADNDLLALDMGRILEALRG
jgi:hypothetical protein